MSERDDQRLRDAFHRMNGEPGEPVQSDALWEAVRGTSDPQTAGELAERLADDPQLREEWSIAAAFAAEADAASEDAPSDPAASASAPAANNSAYKWWVGLAVAAAAVLIGLVFWPAPPSPVRYGPDGQVRTGTQAALLSRTEGSLPASNAILRWTPLENATRYDVHVTTDRLEPVFDATDLPDPAVTIDADRLTELPAGTTLLWRVEASMKDGTRRRSSTFTNTLEQP